MNYTNNYLFESYDSDKYELQTFSYEEFMYKIGKKQFSNLNRDYLDFEFYEEIFNE